MQVECNDVVGSSDGEQVGDQPVCQRNPGFAQSDLLGSYWSSGLVLFVLSRVREARDDRSNALGRSGLASCIRQSRGVVLQR